MRARDFVPLMPLGWGRWIRTTIGGVRVRSPAVERSPTSEGILGHTVLGDKQMSAHRSARTGRYVAG